MWLAPDVLGAARETLKKSPDLGKILRFHSPSTPVNAIRPVRVVPDRDGSGFVLEGFDALVERY